MTEDTSAEPPETQGPLDPKNRRHKGWRWALGVGSLAGAALVTAVVTDSWEWVSSRLSATPPLTAEVSGFADCPGGDFILPASTEPTTLPDFTDLDATWVYAAGGGESDLGDVYAAVVQGTSDEAVVLTDLRVVDVARLDGGDTIRVSKCSGGGDLYPRAFQIDLDPEQPTVTAVPGDVEEPGDGADPAIDFPYTVSASDPEYFYLTVSEGCDCSWGLELDWSSGGRTGSLRLTPESQDAFRTLTASATVAQYVYADDGTWVPR